MMSSVRDYALSNWRQETIVLLCQVFLRANLEMCHSYAAPEPVIEFINRETMALIIFIFDEKECVNTIDDTEIRGWIRLCIEEPAQVFVPLGREVAERWLIDSWDPVFCMFTVLAVVNVLHGEDPPVLTAVPPIDTILEVARWAQFEENAIWHHHVGSCLSFFEHYDAAIEQLNTALALEPIWRAKRNLAEVYWKKDRLKDSLRLFREGEAQYAPPPTNLRTEHGIHDFEKEKARDLAELRKKMGLLYIQLGDHSSATCSLMRSIELWDFVHICTPVFLIIRALVASKSSRDERILQVLKMVDRDPWSYNETVLSRAMKRNFEDWDCWDNTQLPLVYAVSAKRCNDLEWLECKYQTLIEENSGRDIDMICLNESLAHLYDRFLGEEGKAILIWKSIIAQYRVPDSIRYETFCRARNRAVAAYGYRLLANGLNWERPISYHIGAREDLRHRDSVPGEQ
ncbi:hypothetical protein PMG11_10049 [Penicillium brasilianum]|uniref:Uncharacterized protein n=1 Tax=Penicillium brasilianum TaxID=104259 RepID=A0A0F7TXZ4_PENBI|nr:hypothetical protein PMG11_10049 [Penicillium brasilianum]